MKGRKGRAVAEREREEGRVIINLIREKGNKGQLLSGEGLDRGWIEGANCATAFPFFVPSSLARVAPARPIVARIVVSSGTTSTIIINKTCL